MSQINSISMPSLLKEIDLNRRLLSQEDTGILVQTRPRHRRQQDIRRQQNQNINKPANDVLHWLKQFADDYWKLKNPDESPEVKMEESEDRNGDAKEESANEKNDGAKEVKEKNQSPIRFVIRDINSDLETPGSAAQNTQTLVFVASNLCDPGNYLHFVFDEMARNEKKRKTRAPYRAMPVIGLCLVKHKQIEQLAMSMLENIIKEDPLRFSIQFFGGFRYCENMTQMEAAAIVRNCIWSLNPSCTQCLKYQDIAFTIDVVKPFFCIGYLYDFIKLGRYTTQGLRNGYDLSGEGYDSEDDISDDPTLDEEEEKKRKIRIKRKRNAEKAKLEKIENGNSKENALDEIEDEDTHASNGLDGEENEEGNDAEEEKNTD